MNAKTFANLNRQFLRFIEELSAENLKALEDKSRRLEIRLSTPSNRKESRTLRVSPSEEELVTLGKNLRSCSSSGEAMDLLTELSKEELTQLSRVLDLPVQKSESVERIKERLVQSTIGFRLRSEAIQRDQSL